MNSLSSAETSLCHTKCQRKLLWRLEAVPATVCVCEVNTLLRSYLGEEAKLSSLEVYMKCAWRVL